MTLSSQKYIYIYILWHCLLFDIEYYQVTLLGLEVRGKIRRNYKKHMVDKWCGP